MASKSARRHMTQAPAGWAWTSCVRRNDPCGKEDERPSQVPSFPATDDQERHACKKTGDEVGTGEHAAFRPQPTPPTTQYRHAGERLLHREARSASAPRTPARGALGREARGRQASNRPAHRADGELTAIALVAVDPKGNAMSVARARRSESRTSSSRVSCGTGRTLYGVAFLDSRPRLALSRRGAGSRPG